MFVYFMLIKSRGDCHRVIAFAPKIQRAILAQRMLLVGPPGQRGKLETKIVQKPPVTSNRRYTVVQILGD